MTTQSTPDPRFRCTGRGCADLVIEGERNADAHELVRHDGRNLTRPMAAEVPATEAAQVALTAGARAIVTRDIPGTWVGTVAAGTVVTIVDLGPNALAPGEAYAAELSDGLTVSFAADDLAPARDAADEIVAMLRRQAALRELELNEASAKARKVRDCGDSVSMRNAFEDQRLAQVRWEQADTALRHAVRIAAR